MTAKTVEEILEGLAKCDPSLGEDIDPILSSEVWPQVHIPNQNRNLTSKKL